MDAWMRRLAVWLAALLASAALVRLAAPELVGAAQALDRGAAGAAGFGRWLVWVAALATAGCAVWFAVVATLVVLTAGARPPRSLPGCPQALRRALLVACGALVAGGTIAPAGAEPGHPGARPEIAELVVGLPLPHRTVDGPLHQQVRARADVVVAPGDSLWSLAAASLPAGAAAARVDRRWREIYRLNRSAIGPDPDLIHPGLRLRLPRSGEETRR